MDSTLVHQPVAQAFLFRENESRKGPYAANVLPATPVYSRPGSSCSQPPTLYSNGPSVMTPAASPPTSHKASMLTESTDAYDVNQFPSTPPLSASGSTVGSPKMAESVQMPLNPMFSGLDGFFPSKDMFDSVETSILDWSSAGSPPMTPAYMHNASQVSEILSATSCPSLSPSPAPYARSLSSDSGVDFCDPRNLTVAGGSSNPTLSTELSISSLGEEEIKADAATSQPTFAFNPTLNGLPGFEDFSDSEEDFCNLVNLGDVSAETRPRACTGSSIVSLGHGSFIGDDDLSFDTDAFAFPTLASPCEDDCHKDKKQKKSHKKEVRASKPVVNTAANATTQASKPEIESAKSIAESESANSSGSEDSGSAVPPVPSRRGRKQSLTEDPSKTFVCDLCNRRFRRQEHLKRHYRSLHTQEKPFECNECGKKFSRSDNLAQHARTHSSGGIVMGVLEEGEQSSFDGSMIAPPGGDDYNNYGKVLFQIASEIPGSASDLSSEEASEQGRKKRKRSD